MVKTLTEFDTIAAISTPIGEGGISIVRMSGEAAVKIANGVFKGGDLTVVPSHTIHYGHLIDPADQQVIDEVMVSVMRAPKTFTREDIVEINCHGGIVVTNRILQLLLKRGARMAEAGEFTKRAFVNGRIDLTQAESVMDIVRAKTDRARQVAESQLEGGLLSKIQAMRQELLDTLANVEVNIDYPEYDADTITADQMIIVSKSVLGKIARLLETAAEGTALRNGLATAIIGRPNVGKSSLLNYLTKSDTAIVTDVAGTTRDTLEEYVAVKGVPLQLIDTAGIRETDNKVEKIGVERSKKALAKADLVLLLFDASRALTAEDRALIAATAGKKRIAILNKIDLGQQITVDQLKQLTASQVIATSILHEKNLDQLEEAIKDLFFSGIENSNDQVMVTNQRQVGLLEQAKQQLQDVVQALTGDVPVDIAQIDFNGAWETLGEITGESSPDELVNKLFSQFCLGK
ncbi:tRNA uridine-5-carboxymethylaminomethyl(34) synthesis GTPase MnmE [Lactobacillus xylocopicola]|uniref:tRNA modification GTPase MnmE n=1 Tax=Lactobacillus xylocopicola TaxID=2976676 RepID=A0ABM8BIW3_9LACO|nr:tRNA uridine-5-carboxymethylaminomethyl(34) synthesis GTPase MnmE [Lactobacillus xylocopicola]BDR61247.1 tRNA modification GTPase MnmE [Lactobacillus xylocopicola]